MMVDLRSARLKENLEDFIKEHEGDPKGDADKLEAVLKRLGLESVSEVPKALRRDASDD